MKQNLYLHYPVEGGNFQTKYFEDINEKKGLTLGYLASNDISFNWIEKDATTRFDGISREHCVINKTGDGFMLKRISTRETFVNGEAITAKGKILKHGDEISLVPEYNNNHTILLMKILDQNEEHESYFNLPNPTVIEKNPWVTLEEKTKRYLVEGTKSITLGKKETLIFSCLWLNRNQLVTRQNLVDAINKPYFDSVQEGNPNNQLRYGDEPKQAISRINKKLQALGMPPGSIKKVPDGYIFDNTKNKRQ